MFQTQGKMAGPFLMIHGGAGSPDPDQKALNEAVDAIKDIALKVVSPEYRLLTSHERVLLALELLESHPRFNAGYGSSLQKDGLARLTAAFMDGDQGRFSAVLGATDLWHPSRLAYALQKRQTRILTQPGVELLSRELHIPVKSPIAPHRRKQWFLQQEAAPPERPWGAEATDTVGALFFDGKSLCVGASTGGRGGEIPGRVSDTCSVAGTYATAYAGILATGIGEQIIDDAVAARLEARVRDGMSLHEASHKAFIEAQNQGRQYGWIAADRKGFFSCAHTTPRMTFAVVDLEGHLVASSYVPQVSD